MSALYIPRSPYAQDDRAVGVVLHRDDARLLTLISGRRGVCNQRAGPPSPLQLAVSGSFFADEFWATRPPWVVQKMLFDGLAPVGKLLGYRPEYPYSHGSTEGSRAGG